MIRISAFLLLATLAPCSPDKTKGSDAASDVAQPTPAIDFSWRKHEGDFPQDKPGYLILTTEDAVTYSKVLPEFVKQKEAMGFHVYLATEKDYGTGKTGHAQAAQVRAWMREFNKRAKLKYALLIGNTQSGSTDLPSPAVPDGERFGLEESYCDLDGKWVDVYLNATPEEARALPYNYYGSQLAPKAMREFGKREDELIMSRIALVGNEIGNSIYDLDRILEKTIRYERETVSGKNLDWRANALSVTTDYGAGNWDAPWLKAAELEGGTFELRSDRGWFGGMTAAENMVDRRVANTEMYAQTRRRGLVATMSHGWQRGGSRIMSQQEIFRDMDSRWPSAVSVAACSAFALNDNCNTGQSWLRTGGIFAIGTCSSRNNGARVPFQTRLLRDRVSVGEAAKNEVTQYGDPSLHVLPPKGTPLRELQVSPTLSGHYEERTAYPNTPIQPLTQTYTLTNHSKAAMKITVETNAPWITLSSTSVALKPGASAEVIATSNAKADKLAPGTSVAEIHFRREDGQVDFRRLSMFVQPLTLLACYAFEPGENGLYFPDLSKEAGFDREAAGLWLVNRKVDPNARKISPGKDRVPGFGIDPKGKIGTALRLDKPVKPWTRSLLGYTQWRGRSVSFWFKLDELPPAKQTTTILAAPFTLSVDSAGLLTVSGGRKPAKLEPIKAGEWHFVQLRSEVANRMLKASIDGHPEVVTDANTPAGSLALGSFAGSVDELMVWSGEITDSYSANVLAASGKTWEPKTPVIPTAAIAEYGTLRAPKEIPTFLEMSDPNVTLDIASTLAANKLTCTLRDAPEWLDFKDGVFSLKPGTDFDRIDFGGYVVILVLAAEEGPYAGCVAEHSIRVRIPVPAVQIRLERNADNIISFVNAGDRFGNAERPLAKGLIRYTTDGSPVDMNSTIYKEPFKAQEGMKITARFFYLNEYPMYPVTSKTEFGISHEKWKALSVSGNPSTLAAAGKAFDGKSETFWNNVGDVMPQALAWDMGEVVTVAAVSCHSAIPSTRGRIKDYVLHASDDGKTWRKIQSGTYTNTPNAHRIELEKPISARYLKLEATSVYDGKNMIIAELEVYSR